MEMDHPYGSGHVCSIILFWERGGLVERRDENIIKFTSRLSLGGCLTEEFTVTNKTNRDTKKQTNTASNKQAHVSFQETRFHSVHRQSILLTAWFSFSAFFAQGVSNALR